MKTVIRAFAAAVRRAPWVIVAVVVVLTAVFGSLSSQAEIAQGNEGFAPDNEEIRASERISELFGTEAQESVLQIIVRSENGDGNVISADGIATVNAVTQAVAGAAGDSLSEQPGRGAIVSYLAPVQAAVQQQGIPVESLDDAAVQNIYTQALSSPEFQGQGGFITTLLSEGADPQAATATGGLVLVFTESPGGDADEAFDAAIELDSSIAEAVEALDLPDGIEARPFSFSLLFSEQDDFTSEVGRLFGFAALIILVILGFVYWLRPNGGSTIWQSSRRTLADLLLTLFSIFAAIGWMQGIGYLLEQAGVIGSFNPVTQIIPVLLIGLGVDYGIHITSRYREEAGSGQTVDGSIRTAIGTVGVALTLATVTTAIGFLTNVFNPVPALKDFGILAALGIVISFVLMMTFVPAVRLLLDRRAEAKGMLPTTSFGTSSDRFLPKLIERTSVLAERIPITTIALALVLGGLGVYGLTQLETRFSFTDFLPEDAPAVETLDILTEEFGGGLGESSQILVEGDGDLATASIHNALVDATANLAETADVVTFDTPAGQVASANSPVGVLQGLFQEGPASAPGPVLAAAEQVGLGPDLKIPEDADASVLWDAVYQAATEQAAAVMHRTEDGTYDAILFDVQTQAGEARADELRVGLLDAVEPVTSGDVTAVATSQQIISAVIVNELSSSQTRSLLITLAIATLVLMISFWLENRRPFLGVLTMLPVALVVFWTYGLMYATGIPFGPVTATLAALAVGIGVPYTIHIARRFEEDRVRCDTLGEALRSTTRHTGGALAGSAFTTMAGFGILITSTLTPFQQMGQVTVYAIGLSLAGAVLVLPSLLALWERYHQRRGDALVEKETVSIV